MNEINGAEIDEVVDEKVTEKVEKGANFLPAWVLEMRSNLSQSQAKLNNAEGRIADLDGSVRQLGMQIDAILPRSPRGSRLHKNNRVNDKKKVSFMDAVVNVDIWHQVISYLDFMQVLRLDRTCKAIRGLQLNDNVFRIAFPNASPRRDTTFREYIKVRAQAKRYLATERRGNTGNDQGMRVEKLMQIFAITSHLDSELSFLENGAITIIVMLIEDKNGAVRDTASGIIANLLYWEGRSTLFGLGLGNCHGLFPAQVVNNANGRRKLVSLLTSPSASVNLMQPAGQTHGFSRTSSVRGMAQRRGCRALVNLFCPLAAIPPDLHKEIYPSRLLDDLRTWQFIFYHKSGAVKETFSVNMMISEDGNIIGPGNDDYGAFTFSGKREEDIDGPVYYIKATYLTRTYPHLSLLAYWSSGCIENEYSEMQEIDSKREKDFFLTLALSNSDVVPISHRDYESFGVNGSGFYGVWETTSSDSHFALQKGGVFRAGML